MRPDIAGTDCTQQGIDDCMERHIRIAVSCKPFFVIDQDAAKPEFFVFNKTVNIIPHTHANRWQVSHEVFRKGKLGKALVPRHVNDAAAGREQDLRIVARLFRSAPRSMSRQNVVISESLRSLDPPQVFPRGGAGHHPVLVARQTIDDWENGNGPSVVDESVEQTFQDRERNDRTSRIVDQNVFR